MKDTKCLDDKSALKEGPSTKKFPLLLVAGLVLVTLFALSIIALGIKNKEDALDLIDDTISSIESLLNETSDIDEKLSDLPENFLDSEIATGEEIDESLTDLDSQIEELDGLDDDFDLDSEDIGIE